MPSLCIEAALLIVITLLIYFFEPQASEALAYYHTGIEQFELWRLITATFCHTNLNHMLMNLIGLVITLGLFIDTFKKMKIFPLIIFNSVFIGATLFLIEPDVIWYVGFSGVLHGLFSYGVLSDIQQKDRWGYLLGIGLVVKIGYEQFFGAQQTTIELIGAAVLINAHLYGVLAGLCFYFMTITYPLPWLIKKR